MDPLEGSSRRIYTVSEVTGLIKAELEGRFTSIWVQGEISDFTRAHSGHLYFTLKDAGSQLQAVMWRSSAQRLSFDLENGLQVICRGRISVYEPRGRYQLLVDRAEPMGKGALQLAFEQLKRKLAQEGLFAEEAKQPLPLLPRRIGVVTSPRGAALIDILRTLERRFARLHIRIYPVRVQGEGAAEEIVAGIEYFASRPEIDVIIVGRGGGSMEDLWAFNHEAVARAIFHSPVPVISAVGHEIDFTIADFAADIRASTPTAAAEMVIEKEQSFRDRIDFLETRSEQSLRRLVLEHRNRVLGLIHHRAFENFKMRIFSLSQAVDELEMRASTAVRTEKERLAEARSRTRLLDQRLKTGIRARLQSLRAVFEKRCAELEGLSPLKILGKGYTLCRKTDSGKPVRRIEEVSPGDDMTVCFLKGSFSCRVGEVDPAVLLVRRGGES
jgi:exodeoxyribonuclease VII large subunit